MQTENTRNDAGEHYSGRFIHRDGRIVDVEGDLKNQSGSLVFPQVEREYLDDIELTDVHDLVSLLEAVRATIAYRDNKEADHLRKQLQRANESVHEMEERAATLEDRFLSFLAERTERAAL
jgi:ABC-type multidrug transport system ATPase subunit